MPDRFPDRDFTKARRDADGFGPAEFHECFRAALAAIAAGFVSAEGLVANPDYLHFSAQSLRTFGERYYEAFLQLEDKNRAFEERTAADAGIKSDLENL